MKLILENWRKFINEQEQDKGLQKNKWFLLKPGDERRELVKQDIFDIIQSTYASIGGHFKISNPDSLDRYNFWIVQDLDSDPEVDVAILGKPDVGGAKLGAAANDGSSKASSAYKDKSAKIRSGETIDGVGNWWGEVSGKPAYALLSRGAPAVEDEREVTKLLAGDDFQWHGEHPDPEAPAVFKKAKGWYTKKFGDKSSTKIIVGNPK